MKENSMKNLLVTPALAFGLAGTAHGADVGGTVTPLPRGPMVPIGGLDMSLLTDI